MLTQKDLGLQFADTIIQEVTTRKQIAVETQFKKRIRTVSLNNTNSPLLFEFDNIIVSKTGFTNPAAQPAGHRKRSGVGRHVLNNTRPIHDQHQVCRRGQ